MFTLAHLSDPHLAPLPEPRWSELIGKRVTGYINWQRKRRFIHDPAALAAIVADIKAQTPDHIAVTGDIANIALAGRISARPRLAGKPRLRARRDFRPRQPRHLCARGRRSRRAAMGRVYVRRRRRRRISLRPAPRQCCADRPLNRRADGAFPCDRLARHEAARRARGDAQQTQGRRPVPHRADPSSAGQRGGTSQAPARCPDPQARDRRARRGFAAARPRPSSHDQLAARTEWHARARSRRAVGIQRARTRQGRGRLQPLQNRRRARRLALRR